MKKNKLINGVVPAIITPFDFKNNIYEQGIYNQIDYLSSNNIKSLFIGGSYGSFALMSISERKQLIKWALSKTQEYKIQSIVQVGTPTTKDSIELANFAESNGADIISSVVPYYYSGSILSEEDILIYFEKLCNSTNLPVHCYNNPKTTGFNILPKFFSKLINIGLSGIKDGGGDIERLTQMLDIVKNSKKSIDYVAGSTSLLLVSVISGANGCVSGVALVIPDLLNKFFKACYNKEIDEALLLQDKILKVRNILNLYGARAIACYDILHHKGIDVGTCRSPWRRFNKKTITSLISNLEDIGCL